MKKTNIVEDRELLEEQRVLANIAANAEAGIRHLLDLQKTARELMPLLRTDQPKAARGVVDELYHHRYEAHRDIDDWLARQLDQLLQLSKTWPKK